MRTLWLAPMLCLVAVCAQEAERIQDPKDAKTEENPAVAKKDDPNPFGVKPDDKPVKVIVADPALTADEKAYIKQIVRDTHDRKTLKGETFVKFRKDLLDRLTDSPKDWSEGDLFARSKTVKEIAGMADNTMLMNYMALSDPMEDAVILYAVKDDKPEKLVERLGSICKTEFSTARLYRGIAVAFLELPKFKEAKLAQKIQFVEGWLLPRVPAAGRQGVQNLLKDMQADLKAAGK